MKVPEKGPVRRVSERFWVELGVDGVVESAEGRKSILTRDIFSPRSRNRVYQSLDVKRCNRYKKREKREVMQGFFDDEQELDTGEERFGSSGTLRD